MPNTTNYNWATPADTDLVKDGAAAIRTLGSSADTTVKNLNPGTTAGDIDYYTSSTAKARVAIGTAGQVLRVNSGGTAPEWATTADQTPLTTKGDLFTFNTADARLGVGANGTVLTADSAEATGLKWATPSSGAYTQLATGSLSGALTAFTGLSASYKDLLVVIRNYKPATDDIDMRLRFNSDTNANRHGGLSGGNWSQNNSTFGAGTSFQISGGNDNSVASGLIYITIPDYVNTTTWKMAFAYSMQTNATTTTNFNFNSFVGTYNQTSAISAVTFLPSSGNFTSGDVIIYGVK